MSTVLYQSKEGSLIPLILLPFTAAYAIIETDRKIVVAIRFKTPEDRSCYSAIEDAQQRYPSLEWKPVPGAHAKNCVGGHKDKWGGYSLVWSKDRSVLQMEDQAMVAALAELDQHQTHGITGSLPEEVSSVKDAKPGSPVVSAPSRK